MPDPTMPPYEPSAEQPKRVCKTYGPSCPTCHPVVYGALARAEALAAGHADWMTVTQWPLDAPQPDDNAQQQSSSADPTGGPR